MYILQKLEYKQEGKELKHISTRVIKTFSERKLTLNPVISEI